MAAKMHKQNGRGPGVSAVAILRPGVEGENEDVGNVKESFAQTSGGCLRGSAEMRS